MNITIFNSFPKAKRRLICNEAARLLVTYGFHETNMESIANACGIKKASMYYYFSSKIDLCRQLMAQLLNYSQQNYFSISDVEQLNNLRFTLMHWELSTIDQKILGVLPHRLTLVRDDQLRSLTKEYFDKWRHFFGYTACFDQKFDKNASFYQWCGQSLIEPMFKDIHSSVTIHQKCSLDECATCG